MKKFKLTDTAMVLSQESLLPTEAILDYAKIQPTKIKNRHHTYLSIALL